MRSFEIILEIGNREMDQKEKEKYCDEKNKIYLEYIRRMHEDEILPGVREFLKSARDKGYKTALGSASKNAKLILSRLNLENYLDVIIDGTKVSKAKPNPEVFDKGAQALGLIPEDCIVFEDAAEGIRAAHAAGMKAVGIGTKEVLPEADYHLQGFARTSVEEIENALLYM